MPSSVIRFYRYTEQSRELTVHFVSGRRYVYLQVPAATAAGLRTADSKGTYFNAHIRDHFAYRELEDLRR